MKLSRLAVVLALTACKPTTDVTPPSVAGASPAFGPLSGGTIVMLSGSGFLVNAAAPDHVLVGGVESPLASVIDDHTLQFVLPPGSQSGDAAIAVFNQNGDGSAAGIFHYSDQPNVSSITPPKVLFSSTTTTMTVTGTGFQTENAGLASVFVDGLPAVDVQVQSDTQLTFTTLPNTPLTTPDVEITNARGSGTLKNAYLYVPGTNPGLLLFSNDNSTFFTFFDPIGGTTVSVPLQQANINNTHIRAIAAQADGTYIVLRSDGQFGVMDFKTQQILAPRQIDDRFPAATELGGQLYAISTTKQGLVTIDPASGTVTHVGSAVYPSGNGTAIAADGSGNLFYAGGQDGHPDGIIQVDPTTGSGSNFVAFTPDQHVSEMRFLGGVLYATSNEDVIAIDPATGSAASVHTFPSQLTAMEVLQ